MIMSPLVGTKWTELHEIVYSDDSLKWRTHLSGAFGVFSNAHEIHLSGAPEKTYKAVAKRPENARNC